MTGPEMIEARARLGELWGKGKPLTRRQLARACRIGGKKDPGESIRNYEAGVTGIKPSLAALVEVYLRGALPPDGIP